VGFLVEELTNTRNDAGARSVLLEYSFFIVTVSVKSSKLYFFLNSLTWVFSDVNCNSKSQKVESVEDR
jgi:hypothetical protein